jgi:adenylate cyclase
MERSLVAIMAADVCAYSRLMAEDEAATLARLRQLKTAVLGPGIAGHRGRIVKTMGDGWLVEFGSSLDAVGCAVQLQDRLAADPILHLRIGIHLGDVVREGDDIYGSAVNLAFRLQETAEPGGVAISDVLHASLDGTLAPVFEDVGVTELKNIDRPVRVWHRHSQHRPDPPGARGAASAGDRPIFPIVRIAPVSTSDTRPEVRDVADALTSDFATYLDGLRWLTASIVEEPEPDAYVLRGVLRARGAALRLEMRLTSPRDGTIWTAKHDGELSDDFEWQDRTGEEVAVCAVEAIQRTERQWLAGRPREELSAAECLLLGLLQVSFAEHDLRQALAAYSAAIDKDPGFGIAYAQGATCLFTAAMLGFERQVADYAACRERWLAEAERLLPLPSPWGTGMIMARHFESPDEARLRRALYDMIRQSPLDFEVLFNAGWAYNYLGEPRQAIDCFRKCQRLALSSPYGVASNAGLANAFVQLGDDEAAIRHVEEGLRYLPRYPALHRALAAAQAHLDRPDAARATLRALLDLTPGDRVSDIRMRSAYVDRPGPNRYLEGLGRAGMMD